MRPLACLLIPLGLAAPVAAGEVSAELRAELARAGRAFERAVAQVSPPSPSLLLGGAGASRQYYLPGYGAVIVLSPRALPERGVVHLLRHRLPVQSLAATEALLERRLARARSAEERDAITASLEQLRRARDTLSTSTRVVVRSTAPRARGRGERSTDVELRDLEAQVEAFRREAERYRREAETALEIVALSAREAEGEAAELAELPEPLPPPAPEAAPTPAEPLLAPEPPPPAPWAFWFEAHEEEAPQTAASDATAVARARAALVSALASADPVPALGADETLAVALDFHSAGPPLAPRPPARTLVVRVRAGDLAARSVGRLKLEQLERRIEVSEY